MLDAKQLATKSLVILFFVCVLLIPLAIFFEDIFGWIFLYFSFLFLPLFKEFREDGKLLIIAFISLSARHLIVLDTVFLRVLNFWESDSAGYHYGAVKLSESANFLERLSIDPLLLLEKYQRFLALFYKVFGSSFFVAHEVTILIYIITLVVFVRFVYFLRLESFRHGLVALYALLPSSVYIGSNVLREQLQMCFILLTAFFVLQIKDQLSLRRIVLALMSVSILYMTHHSMRYVAVYILVLAFIYLFIIYPSQISLTKKLVAYIFFVLTLALFFVYYKDKMHFLSPMDLLKHAEMFRNQSIVYMGRTNYGVILDTSSFYTAIKTLMQVIVCYLAMPFFWQVQNFGDFVIMLETLLRLTLLFFALKQFMHSSGIARSYTLFVLLFYFVLEIQWAMGSLNWGSAMRHRLPAYGLLLLSGGSGFLSFLSDCFRFMHIRLHKSTIHS